MLPSFSILATSYKISRRNAEGSCLSCILTLAFLNQLSMHLLHSQLLTHLTLPQDLFVNSYGKQSYPTDSCLFSDSVCCHRGGRGGGFFCLWTWPNIANKHISGLFRDLNSIFYIFWFVLSSVSEGESGLLGAVLPFSRTLPLAFLQSLSED